MILLRVLTSNEPSTAPERAILRVTPVRQRWPRTRRAPLQASLLMRNSPDYNTRGLHNMGQASVNLSHNPAWFHRKAIQEFRVQLTCTKESTMLIKGTALK